MEWIIGLIVAAFIGGGAWVTKKQKEDQNEADKETMSRIRSVRPVDPDDILKRLRDVGGQ